MSIISEWCEQKTYLQKCTFETCEENEKKTRITVNVCTFQTETSPWIVKFIDVEKLYGSQNFFVIILCLMATVAGFLCIQIWRQPQIGQDSISSDDRLIPFLITWEIFNTLLLIDHKHIWLNTHLTNTSTQHRDRPEWWLHENVFKFTCRHRRLRYSKLKLRTINKW